MVIYHYNKHIMKYFIRSVKYFFYFAFLTCAIILVLVAIGAVEGNINAIFEGGYTALWKIAAFFSVVAAVYPSLAFIKRDIPFEGDFNSFKNDIIEYMKDRRYELESNSAEQMSFRIKGIAGKLSKMYEDRIIITPHQDGFQIDGLRKDVLRIAAGLESKTQN